MTGAQREGLSEAALAMTQPIIDELIKDICRRVAGAGAITDTAEYQIYRAEALGASEEEIKAAIARQLKTQDAVIGSLFEYVCDKSLAFEDNGSLRQIAAAYARMTKNKIAAQLKNLWADTPDGAALPLQEAYAHNMDFAFRKVATGATDINTAIRQAVALLAKRGLRTIEQKSGRSVGIEYVVRRYLMDRLGSLDDEVQQGNHDALGCDGWEISAHAACAPDHEPYQGRQFSDADYEALNNRLQRRIGHLNCGHTASPIIMGVNAPQYTDDELRQFREDNERGVTYQGHTYTLYEAGQKQSSIENGIRLIKRQCLADEETGSPDLQKHQIKLRIWQAEYRRYCKAVGLPTRTERLQAAGFGRKQTGQVWGYQSGGRKILQKLNFAEGTAPEDEIEICRELQKLPAKQKELAEKQIARVNVTDDAVGSGYRPKSKELYISKIRKPGDVVHEYGHALEQELDLRHNAEFQRLRRKGLDLADFSKVVYDDTTYTKPIYLIQSDKFVSEYQGRIYEHPVYGVYSKDSSSVNDKMMLEYFSEGYREYYMNPDNLKKHDPDLYEFIRRLPQ